MPTLIVFGEHLCHRAGGAETSTYLLTRRLAENQALHVVPVSGVSERYELRLDRVPYDDLVELPLTSLSVRLPFFEYALNSRPVGDYMRAASGDILFANGMAAPAAINAFEGPSVYFIHDEMSLNVYRTYETRPLKRLKFGVRWQIDLPFMLSYRSDNMKAMRRAKLVVANSRHVARRATELLGVNPVVVYPQVDVVSLRGEPMPPLEERPFIMMVGDQEVKGAGTFRRIANAMPDHEFLAVGRGFAEGKVGNITFRGFVPDPLTYYRKAKVVLLPSTWEEGFGMVSVEASALGIPTVVSNRGGLPETVPGTDLVVTDYRDPVRWVETIRLVLDDYEARSKKAREHAMQFDGRLQIQLLVERVRAATGVELS